MKAILSTLVVVIYVWMGTGAIWASQPYKSKEEAKESKEDKTEDKDAPTAAPEGKDKEHPGKEHGGQEHPGKEHGGQEHGGKEHGGSSFNQNIKLHSPDAIRSAMKQHILDKSKKGIFTVTDKYTGKKHQLRLKRVHKRVGKTAGNFYSCADFEDVKTGKLLDLDIDLFDDKGTLKVVDVRVHKVSGKPHYTYDQNDNRIDL